MRECSMARTLPEPELRVTLAGLSWRNVQRVLAIAETQSLLDSMMQERDISMLRNDGAGFLRNSRPCICRFMMDLRVPTGEWLLSYNGASTEIGRQLMQLAKSQRTKLIGVEQSRDAVAELMELGCVHSLYLSLYVVWHNARHPCVISTTMFYIPL